MAKKSNLEKTINKQKKAHPVAFLLVVLFLVVGAVAGYFVVQYLTKNDRFEIIGEQTITLNIGETYEDEGAIAISFGRDISDRIVVETDIPENEIAEAGRYYIKYTIDDIRYSGVVKYRYIIYLEEESEASSDSQNGDVQESVLEQEKANDVNIEENAKNIHENAEIFEKNILRGGGDSQWLRRKLPPLSKFGQRFYAF